jgi:hypothetical protein
MAELLYELTFTGVASTTLRAAFDDCALEASHGTTTLRCRRAALPEMLDRVQSFGLELVNVRLVAEPAPGDPP